VSDAERPVLVTGATGTVGATVVAALGSEDVPVRAAARDIDAAREQLGDRPTYVRFDFEKPETWGGTFENVERMFLMRPPTAGAGTIRPAIDAAVRVGIEHIVYLSVLGAGKNPLVPHRRIERHLEASGAAHTFLRASFFMQNLAEVHAESIREYDEIFVPAGSGRTSFIDARDIGAVAATVLTEFRNESHAYDLTGTVALDYEEVAEVLSRVLGRPIEYADPSIPAFVRRMSAQGRPLPFIAVMVGIYTTARLGFSARTTDDVERVLGREPTPLREFAADYRGRFSAAADSARAE
jgi:uncharacterized protein YbjT (DUF2867 family)